MNYYAIAFYRFTPIADPHAEVKKQKAFCADRDITSRIYISKDGINGQMSASKQATAEYIEWMHSRAEFRDVHFKLHPYHEHVFPRKCIKVRPKLVAIDEVIDLENQAEHVSPKQWREMMEQGGHILL
ncbi:MAG: rhodanese domain-containing protein, partial [Chlamydiia bacterium]|nr:rhodanese domain-containing protein [Chlamydiia bacterium]